MRLCLFLFSITIFAASASAEQEPPRRSVGPHWTAAALRDAHGPYSEDELQIIAAMTAEGGKVAANSIVTFGPDYLAVAAEDGQTIVDVKLGRIIQVDRNAGTFLNDSLYAAVVLAEGELKKRTMLRQGAMHANASWPAYLKPFWVESDLGIENDPRAGLDLRRIDHEDGSASVIFENQVVVVWESSNLALTEAQSHKLELYLQYQLKLHPRVRRAIAEGRRLPKRIRYTLFQGGSRVEEEFRFRLAQRRPAAYPLPAEARPALQARAEGPAEGDVFRLMFAAVDRRHGDPEKTLTDYLIDAWSSVSTDSMFEAWLALTEAKLHYAHDLTFCSDPDPAAGSCFDADFVREVLLKDERVERLRSALGLGNSPEELERKVAQLESVSRSDVARGHLADVFLGDALSRRPDLAENLGLDAAALISRGIRQNPYVPGYYKILGDHFARNLDFVRAFRCFDLARALPQGPRNENLQEITRLESRLAAEHPAFF